MPWGYVAVCLCVLLKESMLYGGFVVIEGDGRFLGWERLYWRYIQSFSCRELYLDAQRFLFVDSTTRSVFKLSLPTDSVSISFLPTTV